MKIHCELIPTRRYRALDCGYPPRRPPSSSGILCSSEEVWMEAAIQFLIIECCHWRTSVHEISASGRKIDCERCHRILALGNVSATPVPPDGCRLTAISPAMTALTRDTRRR